jgi:hypothetical protein
VDTRRGPENLLLGLAVVGYNLLAHPPDHEAGQGSAEVRPRPFDQHGANSAEWSQEVLLALLDSLRLGRTMDILTAGGEAGRGDCS